MKLLIYSDLHLEFKNPFTLPKEETADVLILAGDILVFKNFDYFEEFLKDWKTKPILYVTGNHEYYTNTSMNKGEQALLEFIKEKKPNLTWLNNSSFTHQDVEFFGGTMWTNFNNSNPMDMWLAQCAMNDYKYIRNSAYHRITPEATVKMHDVFVANLLDWFEKHREKKRVVISHHAPIENPNSNFKGSKYHHAYNSYDMIPIIDSYQPDCWIFGHTHESCDILADKTRIVSNPFGYFNNQENPQFDPKGMQIEI